jgi:preprotein translocase subunit SecY
VSLTKKVSLAGVGATKGARAAIEAAGRLAGLNARHRRHREHASVATEPWPVWSRQASSATSSVACSSLLLALVVYRIGAHIPVPGIDPDQLAQAVQGAAGRHPRACSTCSRAGRCRASRCSRSGIMPYISASIIMQLLTVGRAAARSDQEGRRGGSAQDHPVHALRAPSALALFQALGIAVALESQPGLVHRRRACCFRCRPW